MTSSSSSPLSPIERLTLSESDPGFATSPTSPSRAPARAGAGEPVGLPWCEFCEVHGHATIRCPKTRPAGGLVVSDEHELERVLVGSGFGEIR